MPETQGPFDWDALKREPIHSPGIQRCFFCGTALKPDEIDNPDMTYREVKSWVTGPKLQSPVLRERTGRMAHKSCVEKIINGEAPDQDALPGLDEQ